MANHVPSGAVRPEDLSASCRALFGPRRGETLALHVRHTHQRGEVPPVLAVLETVGRVGGSWRTPRGYRLFFAWTDWFDGTVTTDDEAVTQGLIAARRELATAG